MASAFGHMVVAYAMAKTLNPAGVSTRLWGLSIVCCLLPDVDVLGFMFGIPYEHLWGHRGMTHSISFAVFIGLVVPKLAVPSLPYWSASYGMLVIYFTLVTLSHGLLDAMTDGGLGIAFLSPFDTTRYFFPWRPISVSPIGLAPFFSSTGLGVLVSELIWIGIPVTIWLFSHRVLKNRGQ